MSRQFDRLPGEMLFSCEEATVDEPQGAHVSNRGVCSEPRQPRRRFGVPALRKETFTVVACGRVVQGRGDFTPLERNPPSPRMVPRQRLPPGP